MTEDDLKKYKKCRWSEAPNKNRIPKTVFGPEDIDTFNEIYDFCRENYHKVNPTLSGGIPYNNKCKHVQRYITVTTAISFELVVCTLGGCYRFILMTANKPEENCVSGSEALRILLHMSKKFGVFGTFLNNICDAEEGRRIKNEIESPEITLIRKAYRGKEFENVHHIDFNSSYASRIVEAFPELKEMYEYLYENRKEHNGFYKHILTNSVGAMQSPYCYDITEAHLLKRARYQLAKFAKIAINGNNAKLDEMCFKLEAAGRKPLLLNTDGIWYKGEIYEDENCGPNLCQYKNDHKNCRLYIKSEGAYQYIENGVVNTVLRGSSKLDKLKPDRSTWKWREIDEIDNINTYILTENGVKVNAEEED